MDNDVRIIIGEIISFSKEAKSIIKTFHDWYNENKMIIQSVIETVSELGAWVKAVELMKAHQFIFTDDLSIAFANEVINSDDIDRTVGNYYFANDEIIMNNLIARIKDYKQMSDYEELFDQVIIAYHNDCCILASLGAFAIIDGMMSKISENITETNFRKRLNQIIDKINNNVELDQVDKLLFCIMTSLKTVSGSFFDKYSFDNPERNAVDRNWLLHGRSKRNYKKIDFLKVLLFLDAIIILDNYQSI